MDFAERYGPWAVLAGGSDGIGASVARALGERGVKVVLVARGQAKLDATAATVASETRTLSLDLSRPDAAAELAAATRDLDVGLLVYNAGTDPNLSFFLDKSVEECQALVTRNCATLLGAAHHYGGRLVERGRGGMVLVSSGAAWVGASHNSVYCATKAFDLLLAESLWAELSPRGVDVLGMVVPGTDTPTMRRILGDRAYDLASPDDVARDMLDHLADGPTFPPDPPRYGDLPRREAVERMSAGVAAVHGKQLAGSED